MKKFCLIMSVTAIMTAMGEPASAQRENPLLAEWNTPYQTPPFDKIQVEDYEPALEFAIAEARAELDALVNNPEAPTFENTIVAMENQGKLLGRIAGVYYNLREADTSDELDAIALRIQPKMTALSNDINLNPKLFERVKAVYEGSREGLSAEDVRLLEKTYKNFTRSGAALSDEDKELYRQYTTELSAATLMYGQNALAATNAFTLNITDEAKVAELPEFVREALAAEA